MLSSQFLIVSLLFKVAAGGGYLTATIRGKNKPNRVSFGIWSIAPLIAFAAQLSQGVGVFALLTFIVGFIPLSIFVASFFNKNAYWRLRKFDYACGGLAILGLVLWQITGEGNIAIALSMLADGIAYLPTIRKSYSHPHTETAYTYLLSAIGLAIGLMTVKEFTFQAVGFPLQVLIFDLAVYLIIIYRSKTLIT